MTTNKRIRSFGFWAFTPDPSAQNPKQKNKFIIIKKKPIKMKLIEKYFLNSLLSVAPRCTLLPLVVGAYNTVYAVHSCRRSPIFCSTAFRKTSHILNVSQHRFARWLMCCDCVAVRLLASRRRLTATMQNLLPKPSVLS